jgi:hypothetical protein
LQSTAHNPLARKELSSASRRKALDLKDHYPEEEILVQPIKSFDHKEKRRGRRCLPHQRF